MIMIMTMMTKWRTLKLYHKLKMNTGVVIMISLLTREATNSGLSFRQVFSQQSDSHDSQFKFLVSLHIPFIYYLFFFFSSLISIFMSIIICYLRRLTLQDENICITTYVTI